MTVLAVGASIFVKAFRISELTEEGNVAAGATTVTTKEGMKLSINPTTEAGADIVAKNANDEIVAMARAGDKIKYYVVQLELAQPDPQIEKMFCGGTMLGSSAAALGLYTSHTLKAHENLGSLAKATYGYRVTQYNAFGETKADTEVTVEPGNATPENSVLVIASSAFTSGAIGARVYGRSPGAGQLLGVIPNIGKPKLETAITAKAGKKGEIKVIKVEAASITKGIPGGTILVVGASSVPLKVQGFVEVGAATITVEFLEENAAEIKAEEIKAAFLDTGAITPNGNIPETDTSAGPGENLGYQAPALGPVANANGVSIEAFSYAYIEGAPATTQPYYWWVFPRIRYGHITTRELANANAATIMEGIAIGNPHWGSGPTGEWPNDSTKAYQRIRCGSAVVPSVGYEPVSAIA